MKGIKTKVRHCMYVDGVFHSERWKTQNIYRGVRDPRPYVLSMRSGKRFLVSENPPTVEHHARSVPAWVRP